MELIFFRSMPTCIKINIKLTNANKIVMLSQTHGYDQFVRFPKTVKSISPESVFDRVETRYNSVVSVRWDKVYCS